jgi:hypothetical protein
VFQIFSSTAFKELSQKNFEEVYLNQNIPIPSNFKGIDLSFYRISSYPKNVIEKYKNLTKVDWTKLYLFLVKNPFLGGTDSNYLMAIYNFLR